MYRLSRPLYRVLLTCSEVAARSCWSELPSVASRGLRTPAGRAREAAATTSRSQAASPSSTFSSSVLDDHVQSESSQIKEPLSPEETADREILSKVDEQIENRSYGRLFAVIYVNQRQWKVTTGDVLMVDDFDIGTPPGERIVFDKVVMVGGRDFSLVGRPVLPRDLVRVNATVVEKNISKTNVHLVKWKKLSHSRTYFSRSKQTTFRINAIDLLCPIEEVSDRIGFETREGDPAFL